MSHAQKGSTMALVVVQQGDQVLLIQEAKAECRGKWFLPGGRRMAGESIVETAVREAREESGLDAELTGLLYVDQLLDPVHGENGDRLRFVFAARVHGGQLKTKEDEHSLAACWFPLAEVGTLDTRSPFVEKMVALVASRPGLLPMSSFHILSESDRRQERP